ncbi:hemerythrin domain-containing protein [Legionella cardiaca]|uniref:Hemerythrin domain-containing protein n=1 Tax=Legionella cardiaca TaxID=1071983 RepID=A0ABY8AW86_9GAMM|nr:hemerythrin domain-containing protein [Legionella cardiaca]WED44004.1 hemerythrin domain-containing protein [Legionella cardiaca]
MSIYTYLKQDHRNVEDLLEKIEKLDYGQKELRDQLFNKLKEKIIIHSKAEEKIFYSTLQRFSLTKEEIKHAKEEHADVEEMLERLADNSLDGTAWTQLFKHMASALRHHIKEEESQIFEDAEVELSHERAQKMELAMRNEKHNIEEKIHLHLR